MTIEEFLEKWNDMCYQRKGCRYCPAYRAERRGYSSCFEWGVYHYELMIPYVESWNESLVSEESK